MSRHETLLRELASYSTSDALEARHREAMMALVASDADPFHRSHFAPGHFTASCFIVDDAGRLLLHHHRRLDRWLQMGGHIEAGEAPALAALREGTEESGLTDLELVGEGIFDLDVHLIPAGKGEPDHEHFDVRYLARTRTPDAIKIDRAESNELAWVSLQQAARLMPGEESHRVIDKIEILFRKRSLP